LATVPRNQSLAEGIAGVFAGLTAEDAHFVYEAIRLAMPGGLGTVQEMDVSQEAPAELLAAMRLAADRDLVARQYVDGCEQVLGCVVPWLQAGQHAGWSLTTAIIHAHVRLMAEFPDSLIARKCGVAVAQHSARLAQGVIDAGSPNSRNYQEALADLDFWLRCDGHRRFAGLREGLITVDTR
jgi:triphosphoribosyl-dephospho-CoA synthase